MLKIRNDVNLNKLQKFGYKYVGNYNRGEQWLKEINIIINDENLGGILIQESKKIDFEFPFLKNVEYPRLEIYVQDLIDANLVVKE